MVWKGECAKKVPEGEESEEKELLNGEDSGSPT